MNTAHRCLLSCDAWEEHGLTEAAERGDESPAYSTDIVLILLNCFLVRSSEYEKRRRADGADIGR